MSEFTREKAIKSATNSPMTDDFNDVIDDLRLLTKGSKNISFNDVITGVERLKINHINGVATSLQMNHELTGRLIDLENELEERGPADFCQYGGSPSSVYFDEEETA